jgi:hypothetical protein
MNTSAKFCQEGTQLGQDCGIDAIVISLPCQSIRQRKVKHRLYTENVPPTSDIDMRHMQEVPKSVSQLRFIEEKVNHRGAHTMRLKMGTEPTHQGHLVSVQAHIE